MIRRGKPQYADDRRLETTAYMGPRRAGKRNFNEEYGNPRDCAAGYREFWDDAVFEAYKEAGLTFLIPEGDAFFGTRVTADGVCGETDFTKSDLFRFLEIARRHDLAVYPSQAELMYIMARRAEPLNDEEKRRIADMVTTLKARFPDTVKGLLLTDEPMMKHYGGVASCVEWIRSLAPEWDLFVSMLPIYGTAEMFGADMQSEKYKGHEVTLEMKSEEYSRYISSFGKLLGEFSFDYYAFNRDVGPETLSPTFFRNLELAAEGAKEHGFSMSATLQACRMDRGYDPQSGKTERVIFREVTYEDMRWQAYAALAFGARRLGYFTFWQHYNESQYETFPTAMVVYDEAEPCGWRKTATYDAVQKVNAQIHAFDHVFLRFDWRGCRVINRSGDENVAFVKGDWRDGALGDLQATRDTLVGCFENPEDGREGYWLVNAHNPYFYEWNEITARFHGANRATYWRGGREYDVALTDGALSLRLGAGEGVFVIPYME